MPAGTPVAPAAAPIAAPLPSVSAPAASAPLPPNGGGAARGNFESFRSQRQQTTEGGRTVIREPDRVIVKDPSGQSFIRHNEVDRFRYGARDVQTQRFGDNDTRTIIVRPDGSQIVTEVGPDGTLRRRMRRDRDGREIVIIDNTRIGAGGIGGFFVALPPPILRIPQDRYIVDADGASPDLIYDTLDAPPVDRIDRAYSLDEIRYSPSVRQRMPSIDLDTINFELGSWDISQDQASKLQVIADGLNRAIQRNPREVFLIEGHTDAVGSDVDNLSLSDRRAQSAAELLTQQFGVPAENLVTQGYGEQYLKIPTDGPERQNRRVTVRRITPLLAGQN
jgi:outer membrane protein OmpA-like peptidoglycan-associated protein